MANLILRGTTAPQLQNWTQRYTPRQGLRGEFALKGISSALMATQALQYIALGYEIDLSYKYGISELTVRTPDGSVTVPGSGGQTIIDKWEVAVDDEKPSLFENPNFLALATICDNFAGGTATVSSQLISTIQAAANSAAASSPTGGSLADWLGTLATTNVTDDSNQPLVPNISLYTAFQENLSTAQFQELQYFFLDYARGATNYEHSKYLLRHTTNVPDNYSNNVADFNVEKIYTIAQLLSEAQSAALWILPLPAYLAYKITNYPVPSNVWPDYQFGALKLRSNATTTARNRIEIAQDYLIDTWPIHTYGLVS
jgi:hypothetical protein